MSRHTLVLSGNAEKIYLKIPRGMRSIIIEKMLEDAYNTGRLAFLFEAYKQEFLPDNLSLEEHVNDKAEEKSWTKEIIERAKRKARITE